MTEKSRRVKRVCEISKAIGMGKTLNGKIPWTFHVMSKVLIHFLIIYRTVNYKYVFQHAFKILCNLVCIDLDVSNQKNTVVTTVSDAYHTSYYI